MNLSPAYLKQREEWLEEGREEGREEGKLEAVPRLQARGFSLEEIAEILGLEEVQIRAYLRNQSQS